MVVTIVIMSSFMVAVRAEGDTTNAEIAFSLKYLDRLPKIGDTGFDEFLKVQNIKNIDGDGRNLFAEEETYKQICNEVQNIKDMVDGKKTGYNVADNIGNMSREMKIAGEIYKWVANNISYDDGSEFQDALSVYKSNIGVCEGKANLTNLMMRIAEIPSVTIGTIDDKEGEGHAYNAVYLKDIANNREGWTLIDSTWGGSKSDLDRRKNKDEINKDRIKKYFPAFYNAELGFAEANRTMISEPAHKIESIFMNEIIDGDGDQYYFEVDGVDYELCGKEGNAYIELSGYEEEQANWVQISSDIVNFGLKFKISSDIKLLILKGNEIVDLSEAEQLERVDITDSSRYIVEKGVLYEKNIYGSKGKKLTLPKNKQLKVIGEKALVIDKENLEKLENFKEKFLQEFKEYDEWLACIVIKNSLHKQELPEIRNYILEIYNQIKGNPTKENLIEFESQVKCFRDIRDEFKKNNEYKLREKIKI